MASRPKEPARVTPHMIASVWFETTPAAQVAEARSGKVPLFNWRYSGQSRKNDHDELQRNHVMLVALLERAGSCLLDKNTLNEAAACTTTRETGS